MKARSKTGFNYPRRLELNTDHKYMLVTARKYQRELKVIMGRSVRSRLV